MSDRIRLYRSAGAPVTPYFTRYHVAWYVMCGGIAVVFLLGQVTRFSALFFLATLAFMLLGVFGAFNDRPLFMAPAQALRVVWRKFRHGQVVTHELTSRTMTYAAGVTPLKGLFNITTKIVVLILPGGRELEVPLFMSNKSHSIVVVGVNSGSTEVASARERATIDERRSQMLATMTSSLGPGNSFTQWVMTRRQGQHDGNLYLQSRLARSVLDPQDEVSERARMREFSSDSLIAANGLVRRTGITVCASNPRSWRPRRLHRMTPSQIRQSRAVETAIGLQDGMKSAHIENGHILQPLEFALVAREFWSLGSDQDDFRLRSLLDRTAMLEEADFTKRTGNEVGRDDARRLAQSISTLPEIQREVRNDCLIFDGSYHTVLWVVDSQDRDVPGGYYDPLFQVDCPNFTAFTGTIVPRSHDERSRNERGLLRESKMRMARNVSVADEFAQEREMEGKYSVYSSGGEAVYFRVITIPSGESYEELQDNIATTRTVARDLGVELRTIPASGQVSWFWAAFGVAV